MKLDKSEELEEDVKEFLELSKITIKGMRYLLVKEFLVFFLILAVFSVNVYVLFVVRPRHLELIAVIASILFAATLRKLYTLLLCFSSLRRTKQICFSTKFHIAFMTNDTDEMIQQLEDYLIGKTGDIYAMRNL